MENINSVVTIISSIMMVAISVAYFLSFYWNLKYLLLVKKGGFCWIKANLAIASGLMVLIYIYMYVMLFLGTPVGISVFSNLAIRPVIAYLGFTIAANAHMRYNQEIQNRRDNDYLNLPK